MGDRVRGLPKRCRCGEAVVRNTSRTIKNPGRLFHACPFGREGLKGYVHCGLLEVYILSLVMLVVAMVFSLS
ncbi:unnamed protein product [Brassica rapa subsp. trilocularis]